MRKKLEPVVLALVLVLGTSHALLNGQMPPAAEPAPAVKLPAATDVIAAFVKASGGRDAILKQTSRRAAGTFAVPGQGLKGTVEILAAKPDLMKVTIEVSGLGKILTGFDGTTAWMVNPMTGPMLLDGDQLQQSKDDSEFYGTLHDPGQYQSMETVGRVEFEGRPCYKLRVVRNSGQADMEYYDVATGLLAGSEVTRESPMGAVAATNIVAGYKMFDGVLLPTTMEQRLSGIQQVLALTSVEHNTVPASAFEPPQEIKTLVAAGKR